MTPSIGRIVHYNDGYGNSWPAVVIKVHSDTKVDLGTFTKTYSMSTDVEMYDGEGSKAQTWNWPERKD